MRTRTRLPTATTERISPSIRFIAESSCWCAADRDLPRVDDDADLAFAPIRRVDRARRCRARRRVRSSSSRRALSAQQVGAGERGDERVGRAVDELARALRAGAASVDEHADLVGERSGVLEVVGDEDRRQRELAQQLLQLGAHGALRVRVERRERLVEQDHARAARERARKRDALALAAGERRRPRVGQVRDAEALEVLVGALLAGVGDVLANGQVREERVLLEDEPDATLVRLAKEPRARCRARRRRRARSVRAAGGRARRSPGAPTSCRHPTARRGRRCRRPRALAPAQKTRSGSVKSAAEGCHSEVSLREISSAALIRTSSALIASVTSKLTSNSRVDRERQRLGHLLEAAGEHDRRAELAEAARERKRLAGGETAARQRKHDAEERARRARAERARRGDEVRVDRLERRDRLADVERARDERDRERDRGLRERERDPGRSRASSRAARSGRTRRAGRCPQPPAEARAAARRA